MSDTTDSNQRTVAAYERHARDYAAAVAQPQAPADAEALRRLADALPRGARVLDVGSGPGWDADLLESFGLQVHRTDVTAAFRDFQAERGKRCDALDLLTDPIEGQYDGVLMLCVLQHFERTQLDPALQKLARATRTGGVVLLSYPLGDGQDWQRGRSGDYRVVRWSSDALDARLTQAGFTVRWSIETETSSDGRWRSVLATAP